MVDIDFKSLVIEKAKEIFIKYGYKKTTMEDIAKACHKSKGLIYHHYNSKEEIFKILVEKELYGMLEKIKKKLDTQISLKDKIFYLFEFTNAWMNDTATLYHKIIMDIFEYVDLLRDILTKFHSEGIEIIKEILTEGKDSVFKIDNIQTTTLSVLQMMMGFMYLPLKKILNIDFESYPDINSYFEIIYKGLLIR